MLFIKICLAVFYLTKVLLFEEKESHFGPFPSSTEYVYDPDTYRTQPVTLFDWVRRLTLNPYQVQNKMWVVNPREMERWSCPTCLSFWITLPFTAYLFITGQVKGIFNLFVTHFAITAVSAILNAVVNYVQMWQEETETSGTDPLSGDISGE